VAAGGRHVEVRDGRATDASSVASFAAAPSPWPSFALSVWTLACAASRSSSRR